MTGIISRPCAGLSTPIWIVSSLILPTLIYSFSNRAFSLRTATAIHRHDGHWSSSIHGNLGRGQHSTTLKEKPQWLSDAMGNSNEDDENTTIMTNQLTTGLSGFCLDPELGFVAILTSIVAVDDSDEEEVSRYTAATVVPAAAQAVDNILPSRLTSPQALTLVQLAGGLDLGTPILPPEALWQTIVREGIDGDDDDEEGEDIEDGSSPLVTLLGMDVLPNEDYDSSSAAPGKSASLVPTKAAGWSEEWMEDNLRMEAIQERATQVLGAVKGLPGLQAVTLEQVADAMMYCANQEGALDRQGFSHLLDFMRRSVGVSSALAATTDGGMNWKTDSKVKFVLTINLVEQDSIKTVSVTTLDAFRAIGLAMRHKIQLQVAPECLEEDAVTILEKFPAFRSIQELWEDAKIMDGFIPSMFEKAKEQEGNGPPPPPS